MEITKGNQKGKEAELVTNNESNEEISELVERGKRIRYIRENILKMNKAQLGREIGVAGQYINLVEEGKRSLVYKSLRKLCVLTGYSSDYILFGLDDKAINETRELLKDYTYEEIILEIDTLKAIAKVIKSKKA